jgi:hypothetical protein
MSATVSYSDAKKLVPAGKWDDWLKFINDPNRWRLSVGDVEFPAGTDWSFKSRFGEVKSAVVLKDDGTSAFDRPEYTEAPFMQTIVWGKGDDGLYYYGFVDQSRPHADEPGEERQGKDDHPAVRFFHCVMGFNEKAATGKFETPEQAAAREAHEEAGAGSAVIEVENYAPGHNPSPSFTPTWGGVVGVEVDLKKLQKPIPDPEEPINGLYFVEGGKLLAMIKKGRSDQNAYTGVSTSLSALLIHWAHHPEQFPHK